MANIAIFRINYKSDFILTLNSDAGWLTPFCIKFWTGAPSQAYFAGYDGETYTHCAPVEGEPTKLVVQFDDHHLPIGDLKFQIGYHFTVADFPTSVEDEVLNQASVIIEVNDAPAQVMLDLNGETAPEIEFSLPAYANEAQRIANEEERIEAEQQRIANEDARIAAEETRQQNEQQRINQETARVNEFATLKSQSQAATRNANDAATLANQKAQLAADKAALADDAATLAIQKAQLAAEKAVLANDAAQLANEKAALAQQKAEYAQQQGSYAKDQGDYAKDQGDYAKAQGETAQADHERAETDHGIAADDHTQAGNDHTRAEADHGIAANDHTQAGNDHTRAESDHGIAANDHTQAGNDHTRAESDHGIAADDHTQAGNDHTRAESDHTRAESDHAAVEVYVDSLGAFDISAYHATGGVLAKYADLTAALGTNGANIPEALRKGGMSVKFVQGTAQSSDNKYVQYRLMADAFSTDTNDWSFCGDDVIVDNPEYIKVLLDIYKHIILAIKKDGDVFFGAGVPTQIKEYVLALIEEIVNTLTTKVDKVEGKGLSTNDFTNSEKEVVNTQSIIDNPEFIEVETDSEHKVLGGRKKDGTKFENCPIETPMYATSYINNPEYLSIILDTKKRILEALRKDGKKVLDSCEAREIIIREIAKLKNVQVDGDVQYKNGVPQQVKDYIDNSPEPKSSVASYLQLSTQADNIINVIGFSSFVRKTITVVAPDKYSSWPRLGKVGDTLICLYCRGLTHGDPHQGTGQLYAALSTNGIVWTPKKLVIDTPNMRDGVTGGGNDEDGNMLFINRVGFPGNVATFCEIYKTADGITFEKISTIPATDQLGHCGDIINVPTRGLMAFFGTYGDTRSWGYILSNDNGHTWVRTVVETVPQNECPMEMSAAYLGDGKILVVGRYEGSGTSKMWQLQSEDYGVTWSKVSTNIGGNSNTPSIIYNSESDKISLYIYNRATGKLEYREIDLDDIWDNPTNWPEPTELASGATTQDAGNVTTCIFKGNQIASWYNGDAQNTGIYNIIN